MKVLITGGMGHVGPVVIRYLWIAYPGALLIGYDTGYFAHCLTGEKLYFQSGKLTFSILEI